MLIRMMLKPWWARVVAWACVLAAVIAVIECGSWLAGQPVQNPWRTIATISALAVPFAVVMAAATDPVHRAYTKALEGLPSRDGSAAIVAIWRGPIPTDPRVRDAAIRVGEIRIDEARRFNRFLRRFARFATAGFGLIVGWGAIELLLGATGIAEPFRRGDLNLLVPAAVFFVWGLWTLYAPRRIERRIEVLRRAPDFGTPDIAEPGPSH